MLKEYFNYEIARDRINETIEALVSEYEPNSLHIRKHGSAGGDTLVDERLEGRKLSIKEIGNCRIFSIDKKEVFRFDVSDNYDKRVGVKYIPSRGKDIYEPSLRGANFAYLFEVYFTRQDMEFEQVGDFWGLKK